MGPNKNTIMIVDDNVIMLELVADILQMEGYTNIAKYNDPLDAVKAFCNGESPHIVISDYNMPHFNGTEFLRIAERFVSNLTSVIITADPLDVECSNSNQWRIFDKNVNLCKELPHYISSIHK